MHHRRIRRRIHGRCGVVDALPWHGWRCARFGFRCTLSPRAFIVASALASPVAAVLVVVPVIVVPIVISAIVVVVVIVAVTTASSSTSESLSSSATTALVVVVALRCVSLHTFI